MNSDDESLEICPVCLIHPVGRYNGSGYTKKLPPIRDICIRCSYKKQNEEKNKKRLEKKRENIVPEKSCEICQCIYIPLKINQNICSALCRRKSEDLKLNLKWKENEYKDPPKATLDSREKLASSHLYYSNPSWTKKFKTVRG